MAKVDGTFYTAERLRRGTSPVSPPYAEDEGQQYPVNPPGSGVPSYITLSDTKDGNYLGKNGFVPVVTDENGLTLTPLPQVAENGLISGGIVQWSGVGYIFNVSGAFYRIGGVLYESPAVQITLDAPDATNDRIDVFAVDINSVALDITGSPSGSPVKPQIDPSTQLELTSVIVTASSTEPTLTEEVIYDENTEWTGTKSGTGTANFASTNDPYQGTVSVETTNIQNAFYIEFDNGSTIDVSGFQTLGFQLKLKSAMPANQNLIGILIDGSGNPASSSFNLNFDKFSTDYQFVGLVMAGIPIVDFNIRYLRIVFIRTSGSPTYSGFFLDILKFEGGINPPQTVGSFLGLSDTPSTYSGQASKVVSVKADESGLEFTTVSSGGVQSVTGDGVDNTDPENPVIDLADIATSGSPYDLAQEGASDGDTLTWVAANSRFEPVAGGGGGSNWTVVGSDIYRNSKVTIGQATIITADLGVKQNTTSAAMRIDSLSKSTRRDVIALYEDATTKRYWVDNYGIPTWKFWAGSAEAGALTYTTPSGAIGILVADSEAFTTANRAGIYFYPLVTSATSAGLEFRHRNTVRMAISGTGKTQWNNGGGFSPTVSHIIRAVSGDTNIAVFVNAAGSFGSLVVADSGGVYGYGKSSWGHLGVAPPSGQSHWIRGVGGDAIILNVVNTGATEGIFGVYEAGYAYAKNIQTANFTGSTARQWKLGERKAATTALDTTQYLTVEVNGTIYNIGLVTI